MNILHLSAVKSWGGGGQHIENLCYELSNFDKNIKNIIAIGKDGVFHERLKKSKLNYVPLPLDINVDPRAIYKIISICKKECIDIIHIHGSNSLTLAVLAEKFSNLPPFIYSKKTSFPIRPRLLTRYKYNHPKIKKIICVSEAVKRISEKSIQDKNKLTTIYNGTRIDNKSTITPFKIREEFNIPNDTHIIGHIANHINAKDFETFLSVVNYIVNVKSKTNLVFIQIGEFSELSSDLSDKITQMNLNKYIKLLGYRENASNYLNQFKLLLCTSKSEGLPQVIYEAFYHKIPVVSTCVGGIGEIIDHEVNGFLSNKGDFRSLAINILRLISEPLLITQFTDQSFSKLIPKYTSKNMAMETLEIYKSINNRRNI